MTTIPPLPPEALDNPKLRRMMEQARALNVPDERFFQIMAHAPGYAEALFDALHESHARGSVDHKLKEIIRINLARLAGDPYFSALRSAPALAAGLSEEDVDAGGGDFEHDPRFSDAEKWALAYGHWMYRDPARVNREFYEEGKRHFSEAEIVELGAFIAMHYGMQVFMRTLQLPPAP